MLLTIGMLFLGLVGLFFGGEWLVQGASKIARRLGLSPMVIGLTVVGFGTSTPELLVSVKAALDGESAIAVGNIVGSNVANILLILGVSAVIAALPIFVTQVRRDLAFLVLSVPVLWWFMADGQISRLEGGVLLVGLIAFLASAFLGGAEVEDTDTAPHMPVWKASALTVAGLTALVIGAQLLVDSAVTIATALGVSKAVIGLTIVAVGTSLPELATSVIAALRKQTDIAVGNVIGSSIFNVFGILGVTGLLSPIPVEDRFIQVDMPWMAGATALLIALAFILKGVPRYMGVVLMVIYAVYVLLML